MTVQSVQLGRHPSQFLLSDLPDGTQVEPVNLVSADMHASKGVLYIPPGARPKVALHLFHPRTDQGQNYTIPALLRAGYAVLGRGGRSVNNDVATEHEPLILDMAAGIELLRARGYEQVVALGNSGGAPLAAFYQWQATAAPGMRLTDTAAGDPFDLNSYELPAFDGLVFVAAHPGEGPLLQSLIDPSVAEEGNLRSVDPELDMYDPRNGFRRPPEQSTYTDEFRARHAAGQLVRVRRLDSIARARIADEEGAREGLGDLTDVSARLAAERRAARGSYLLIYRTSANLDFTDLSREPDSRVVSSYFSARPDLDNYGEAGFAHYLTPRAYLSTWSPLSSRATMANSLPSVNVPMLMLHYLGDVGLRRSKVREMFDSCGSTDKNLVMLPGADHYGFLIRDGVVTGERDPGALTCVTDWLHDHFAP